MAGAAGEGEGIVRAAVTTGFGPCKRHAQNGLTAAASGLDGLCTDCRVMITVAMERRNAYNGSQPLHAEPPLKVPNPGGGTPPDSSARKAERLARFKAVLAESSHRGIRYASPAAIREAGSAVGVGEKTANAYYKELVPRRRRAAAP